jgi:signal transduction histidine kinase
VRPLDFLASIKLKLGVVIAAAVVVTVGVMLLGERADLPAVLTGLVAVVLALAMVQVLAHGMTYPLREMVSAARAMERGDYAQRVTATSRDEVGELARAFNAMAAELEEVDRMRKDLVANVSHELRTPISALRALLENLIDGVEPVERSTLETTLRQVERLGGLVEQLLELSKLESGTVPLQRARIDLRPVVQQVLDETRPQAESRGVALALDGAAAVELAADEHRLHEVVANLVSNAVRHSPQGGRVTLRVGAHDGIARLEVLDEGPGIPEGEADRVFERFYRSDHARTATEGGSGLGLAIARWIVELHGGTIRAEAAEPRGCRMVVELPR